jgi:diguanylate cyclase
MTDALPPAAPALTADFLTQIARLVEFARPALGEDDALFSQQTQEMLATLRQPGVDLAAVEAMLGNFRHRLSFAPQDQAVVKATLLRLLNLIIENTHALRLDDRWLKGQIDALVVANPPPVTLRRLDDVERRLRDVMVKQTEATGQVLAAQEETRHLLANVISRLGQATAVSRSYHDRMATNARLLENAQTLSEVATVMKDVLDATQTMARDSLDVRDELQGMHEQAQSTDTQIARLHAELDRLAVLARHDALTGALNRKGMDEALVREVSSVRRRSAPLCLAMIDIDNFKQLNDNFGHAVGDAALRHLAVVARECLRPQDTLARYGGEEFVLLLPDTPLPRGIDALARLQGELARRPFMNAKEVVVVTFSAGVAQLRVDETGMGAIQRADEAMYRAKHAGKNTVVGAD